MKEARRKKQEARRKMKEERRKKKEEGRKKKEDDDIRKNEKTAGTEALGSNTDAIWLHFASFSSSQEQIA